MTDFQKRTFSAILLGPVFLAVVWYGGVLFAGWLIVAGLVALYEWYRLAERLETRRFEIFAAGVFYVLLSFYSFYFLWTLDVKLPFSLLFMVWLSDIGAYGFGKMIGGPKLAPKLSPNKTWAGLGGAVLCPALLCILYFSIENKITMEEIILGAVTGFVIGLAGQGGDLLISLLKRKAGVKDTGTLIPGHGGLLDRIDSLMMASPVFWLLVMYYIARFS